MKVAQDAMPLLVKKNTAGESVLSVPLKVKNSVFGILILLIRDGEHSFNERDLYLLNFLAEKASFSIENVALYENIYENLFAVHYAFVEAIEARDPYTKQHSTRVANYAVSIAMAVGCSRDDMDALRVSSNLHDIGKIGVPDHILLKPDRLTDDEYEVIKKHPLIGGNIIGHFSLWAYPQKIIKHHHERWDGKGYPDGLMGKRIPLFSRILSVADVYDALTSDRSYRKKLSGDAAVKIIKENTGYMFDPMIVDTFLQLYNGGRVGDC
jgi:putative nucleotidyltransferase with HDIG domain